RIVHDGCREGIAEGKASGLKGRVASHPARVGADTNLPTLAIGPLCGGVPGEIAIGARRMAEQGGKACEFVRCRDRAIRLIAAEHEAQVQSVPGRQRRPEALLHRYKLIAAIEDGAAERLAPDRSDALTREGVRSGEGIYLTGQRRSEERRVGKGQRSGVETAQR